jgi:hypothetical protein
MLFGHLINDRKNQISMWNKHREELNILGYTCVPNILPMALLERLRTVTDGLLDSHDHSNVKAQGSMLWTNTDPVFADLVTLPDALATLKNMGFLDPTFSDGYIISKPGGGPRLFWHYDWFHWEGVRSYKLPAPQIFLMYYLTDTSIENGCLRAIPGSHLTQNALHPLLAEPHSRALSTPLSERIEYSDRPDEVAVPVKAGDLLIGDARLLHAAHANQTDKRRTLITLWYQPDWESLPEEVQSQMAAKTQSVTSDWPKEIQKFLASNRYKGNAVPHPRQLWQPAPEREDAYLEDEPELPESLIRYSVARHSIAEYIGKTDYLGEQDWELRVAEEATFWEWLKIYQENLLDEDEQFTLIEILTFSMEKVAQKFGHLQAMIKVEELPEWQALRKILGANPKLHASTIHYWCCFGSDNPEYCLVLAFAMRRVWNESGLKALCR